MSYDNKSDNIDDSHFGTTNLIINYLPQTLTDNEFKKIFSDIGPIAQAKIIRNKSNSYSYGFGFIEFFKAADAEKAIHQLNGLQLKNKRIKVAYSRPHSDDIKKAKLYIKNVPDISVEALNQVFSKYGTIIQSNIASNKGIAFVLYDKREQAERAIENLQGTQLPGASLPLQIKFASANGLKFHNQNNQNLRQMRPHNNSYNGNNYNNNSYNGNNYNNNSYNSNTRSLNSNYNRTSQKNSYQHNNNSSNYYDNHSMENYHHGNFNSKYNSNNNSNNSNNNSNNSNNNINLYGGPIRNNQYSNKSHHTNRYNPMNNPQSASSNQQQYDYNDPYSPYSKPVSNDHYSGQNKSYHHHQNHGNYSQNHNNYQQPNYNGSNKNYQNTGMDQSGHIIFVYNIGLNTEEQLYNLFSKFGQVIKCNVVRKNKGFAFISMTKYENAIKAIENCNNYNLNGNKLQVSFKK